MILRPLFYFKDTKNTGLLIFNYLKQKKWIFNFVVNPNWKKLTDSRKRAKISAGNRKSYHPIETLLNGRLGKNGAGGRRGGDSQLSIDRPHYKISHQRQVCFTLKKSYILSSYIATVEVIEI